MPPPSRSKFDVVGIMVLMLAMMFGGVERVGGWELVLALLPPPAALFSALLFLPTALFYDAVERRRFGGIPGSL